ncbi:MAG: hypothetical protein LBU77_05190 [Clostridiales bacterium]|jgi:hypothetical protein|nr:hypothetical protein [Clostridiales bacterium]
MGNKSRRHYRVAQKEVSFKPTVSNGIFIKNKQKPKIIAVIIIAACLFFLKGLLIGAWVERNR